MADENNPQGIASYEEKRAAYKAALEYDKAGYEATLVAAERYGDEQKAKTAKGCLLDVEEELAKLGGATADYAHSRSSYRYGIQFSRSCECGCGGGETGVRGGAVFSIHSNDAGLSGVALARAAIRASRGRAGDRAVT